MYVMILQHAPVLLLKHVLCISPENNSNPMIA